MAPAILICDPDKDFLAAIKDAKVPNVDIFTALTEIEAQHLIVNRQNKISHTCISVDFCEPKGLPMIHFIKTHRPIMPISLVAAEPTAGFKPEELTQLHIQKVFTKPITAQQLTNDLFPGSFFELDKALAVSEGNEEAVGGTQNIEAGKLHPIDAYSFISGSKSFFDVYVKVGSDKYLMILKSGDQFDADRVASYVKKGVKSFYIKREAQQYYLQYCDKLTNALLSNQNVPVDTKSKQVVNLGDETIQYLKNFGMSELSMQTAVRFVSHTHRLVKDLKLRTNPHMSQFLARLEKSEHSTGTVIILSMLLASMKYSDENTVNCISLSGYLHDIGLFQLPKEIGEADYDTLNDEQKKVFEQHPNLGAELIAKVPNIFPLVPQVVRQHHERRNHKGYPSGLGAGQIATASEIVGIADLFHELLIRRGKEPDFNPSKFIERHYFDEFSFQTIEVFRKTFL